MLADLHAHGNTEDPWVRVEFEQIQESLTFEHDHAAKSWGELVKNKSNFRRIFLCVALQGSVQMTGVSASKFSSDFHGDSADSSSSILQPNHLCTDWIVD